jgi:uncharacterized phage protein (TIGR02218 family)
MATYDQLESSTEASRPIELYEFAMGSTFYRYTSAEDEITIGSDVYTPLAIARGKTEQGSDQNSRSLKVTMPASNELAQEYVDVPPGQKVSLNIFRYQRDETPSFTTQVLLFKGRVQGVRFPNDGHSAEFAIRSIETALNRNLPRYSYAGMCQHILYSNDCGAVATSFDHSGTASSISGNTITVSGAGGSGLDFVGGYLRPTGTNDFRMITAQSGDVLTLLLPFQVDPTGETMQVFAGCDHLIEGDCALVFDQVANFGGFGFVPNRDIFANGVR